jgi:hypothetical protein
VRGTHTRRMAVAQREPTAADLAAIEREWPLIAAELDLVDAEITALCAGERLSELDRRRLRRTERRVLAARRALVEEASQGGAGVAS